MNVDTDIFVNIAFGHTRFRKNLTNENDCTIAPSSFRKHTDTSNMTKWQLAGKNERGRREGKIKRIIV